MLNKAPGFSSISCLATGKADKILTYSLVTKMPESITLICSSTLVLIALATIAIALRYPGLINIKLLGAEILIDGRSIQDPTVENKLLNQK